MGEHESKQQQADAQPVQAHAHTRKQQATAKPSADQVDKLTAQSSGVVIGDQCVFGDTLVGSTTFCTVPITSSHAVDEAEVRVTYVGAREMQIISTPSKLRPELEGPAGQTPLRLAFQPIAKGSFRGTLTIEISSRDGAHRTHHVLVAGRAHAEGTPDWDARDRDEIKKSVAAAEQSENARHVDAGEQAVSAMAKDTKPHPSLTTGQADLHDQYERTLSATLVRLYQARQLGVAQALHNAEHYKRTSHPHEMSLFAQVAIELASIAVGAVLGAQGKELVRLMGAKLTGEAFGALIKEGVKTGAHRLTSSTTESLPGVLPDDVQEFFGQQAERLNDAEFAAQSARLTLHAIMFPMLTQNPERALAAIKALIDSIHASSPDVRTIQSNESSLQWIRYVAHTSLGDNKRNPSVANMDSANKTEAAGGTAPFDGLVDLFFSASTSHPQERVKLESARMTGVKAQSLAVFAQKPLLEQAVPIRALGKSNSDALFNLVVLRDEQGDVTFTDAMGQGSQQAHWFERKGGGDAGIGARQVLSEIASEPLGHRLKVE